MSILDINPNDYEVRLGDTLHYINLIISGHSRSGDSFENHQRAIDYIQGKKEEITNAINALPAGIPSGPVIRKIIWDVLGIWLSVRTDGRLHFQQGSRLAKYYRICAPGDLIPPGGSPDRDFEIESKDGIVYTHVSVSLTYGSTAPYDGYKF